MADRNYTITLKTSELVRIVCALKDNIQQLGECHCKDANEAPCICELIAVSRSTLARLDELESDEINSKTTKTRKALRRACKVIDKCAYCNSDSLSVDALMRRFCQGAV